MLRPHSYGIGFRQDWYKLASSETGLSAVETGLKS